MFDIGFSELLIIAIVALVVLGPERLPKAARFAGLWVRRARAQWFSVKAEFERDLAADEMRRSMQDAKDAMRGIDESVRQHDADLRQEFDGLRERMRSAAPSAPVDATTPANDTAHATPSTAHADRALVQDATNDPMMDGAWPHEAASDGETAPVAATSASTDANDGEDRPARTPGASDAAR